MAYRYAKACADAYEDFVSARERINAAGIEVLSGAAADGMLTIETDQALSPDLLTELGLTQAD